MLEKKQIAWLQENIPIIPLLERLGVNVPPNRVIYCPFHPNSDTPAAKVYEDSNLLYCFYERKHYSTYNVLLKLNVSEADIIKALPENLSEYIPKENFKYPDVPKSVVEEKNIFKKLFILGELWTHQVKQHKNELSQG